MVDDFMLDDSIIKSKGNLGEDILNNIIRNLNIADEAIEEACHEINKHDELFEMHFESFENDIRDFNEIKWKYSDFKNYAEEYDALVDSRYKDKMENICEQLSDIRLENIQIDNNLGITEKEPSHYDTFGGTRLKYKINIEDVLNVDSVDEAMKAEHEERRSMVEAMAKMVSEDSWPEGTSEDTKETIRQYVSNLNGGKMESYEDEIKNLLTQGNFNFITEREQNLSLALDFVPIVGDVKGVIEACTGKEMITNRELSKEEKLMAGISSAVGFIPGVGEAGTIAKAGTKLGAKTAIKEATKYTVKETIKGAGIYEASKVASGLGISPKDQLMAVGGMSLYRGGKAVLKNPAVRNAVSNTVNISRATIKDAIQASRQSTILGSNLGGYGEQLGKSFKKVTSENKLEKQEKASVGKTGEGIPIEKVKSDVLKKIHADDNGAYGYLPNEGTAYDKPEYDFTNVEWAKEMQNIRKDYLEASKQLESDIEIMTAKSCSKEEIAKHVVGVRNEQKVTARSNMTSEEKAGLESRNIELYGNPVGPDSQWLFNKNKKKLMKEGTYIDDDQVWEIVIQKSMKKDDVINTLLGLIH